MPWNNSGRLVVSDIPAGLLERLVPLLSELPSRWKFVIALGIFFAALYYGSCFLIERRLESTIQKTVVTDWLALAFDVKLFTGFLVVMLLVPVFLVMVALAISQRKS